MEKGFGVGFVFGRGSLIGTEWVWFLGTFSKKISSGELIGLIYNELILINSYHSIYNRIRYLLATKKLIPKPF